MSEVIELTSAERVREFYRKQGELREQQRIIKLLYEVSMQYPQPSEESEVLWELERLIKGEADV